MTGNGLRKQHRNLWLRFIITITLTALLTVWALWGGLVVRRYTVNSSKLPEGTSVRIAVVTDLHSLIWGGNQQPLLDAIAAQQPDIIALVGDIVDDQEPIAGAQLFLERVAEIAPTYYVSGNHEFWSGAYDDIHDMIAGYGITVLNNAFEELTVNGVRLRLCGIDDPFVFQYTDDPELLALGNEQALLRDRFSYMDDSAYTILLAHRPELIDDYLQYHFNLILSGHTHGGQARIPFLLNGLWAPDQGWFPQYAGGRYDFGSRTLIVSRGAGAGNTLPRVFNPPELVVVDIAGGE
jgi:predicted MPP superfamily phosphohydrolase